jgi:sugar porter (SP) family MFS transporter
MEQSFSSTPLLPMDYNRYHREQQEQKKQWTGPLIISIAICCLSSVQYGFHMAELNAPARYIRLALGLSKSQLGLVTAIFSIGGLTSSTFASFFSTNYGLKISFIITSICYIIGSFIESEAKSYFTLIFGRFISGMGAGFAIVYVPIYVNDISPVELRGILGSMTQISVNLGILLTQVLAIAWGDMQKWRKILHVGWIIGILNIIGIIFWLVESPKWLMIRSKNVNEELGKQILIELRNDINIKDEIDIWKLDKQAHHILLTNNPHLKDMGFWNYLTDKVYFNSRTIATFMMFGQQFAGINSVIFYGVDILNKVFPNYSILTNVIISIGNTIITAVSSLFLDRVGRKPLLLLSISMMMISLIILTIGVLSNNSVLTVLSIFTYVGTFAIGCGPIPFLIISEVSQGEVKDIAQSWATDCNWISVFVVGTMFPILNDLIGGWVYLIFASVCVSFAFFVKFFVPETKGCSTYEEVWRNRIE